MYVNKSIAAKIILLKHKLHIQLNNSSFPNIFKQALIS